MKLIFDIIKNGKDVPVKRNYHFNMTSGSIGRSDDVDWSLNDSNNYISSNHATVEYKDGIYFIKDHSTNGTFLKYPYKKLPKNISIKINSTDIFIIGDYEIQARFIDNDYSQEDIISNDFSAQNTSISNSVSNNQLIPNDDDFLDDFILEDSNVMDNSFIIPDDDDDEDFNSSVMNMFKDNEDFKEKELNPFNDIETTIMDTELVDDRSFSDPLNEHINIQNFQEVIEEPLEVKTETKQEDITEIIIEKEEILEEKTVSKEINTVEKKPILTKEETEHSISIIEKKLGIELSSLNQEERDFILTEISDIVINCLDGLKNSLNTKEKIKNDLLIANNNNPQTDANPVKMGQHALNLLDNKNENDIKISEAVKKSFTELDIHNIALHRSSKNLINIAVLKFSPKSLEHNFETNGELNALMPKKYQMWDAYNNMFKKLNEDPDFGINLIEKDFSNEYNNILYSIKLTSI
ncbi:type VI secretion system-associated FHA domain protein TagH [Arcobacter sp. LA11]|uniref:type VI secretion system-associated FHA domain protein TagH n=1 Tax=Arcobacter sp. LA11 TaxID=1898176 RepID=UPI0009354DDA|nr:type VI secretion system-associated FHA domain protein TagH [Arcobacter sp. LA11]